jgi:hypothetical protein
LLYCVDVVYVPQCSTLHMSCLGLWTVHSAPPVPLAALCRRAVQCTQASASIWAWEKIGKKGSQHISAPLLFDFCPLRWTNKRRLSSQGCLKAPDNSEKMHSQWADRRGFCQHCEALCDQMFTHELNECYGRSRCNPDHMDMEMWSIYTGTMPRCDLPNVFWAIHCDELPLHVPLVPNHSQSFRMIHFIIIQNHS